MQFNSLKDFDVTGKTVLVRADLNVPVQDGKVTDTTRIDRVKPTIDYLLGKGAKIVVLSHYGRPKGKPNAEFSQSFLPPVLEAQWGNKVAFVEKPSGAFEDDITLIENLRFHPGEEQNDPEFAKFLSTLGDIYVNDAFSAAHRAHASTEGITHYLPSCAGMLMESELNALNDALENPEKPVVAVVGGAKVSTKLSVLNNLVQKVDYLVLGGGMANTFLYADGKEVGMSLCEPDMAEEARTITDTAAKAGCQIIIPEDQVAIREFKAGAAHEIIKVGTIAKDQESVDIGPKTIGVIEAILDDCKTVLWNGPMGVFEMKPFDTGTNKVAQKVAQLTKEKGITSVAGGGDTVSALENAGVIDDFTYISAAGGAFLEWLEGKTLPGVAALETAKAKAA